MPRAMRISCGAHAGRAWCAAAFFLLAPSALSGQQVVDTTFRAAVQFPTYGPGAGPVILFDEGHHNGHSLDGTFRPFADLLRADGYQVRPSRVRLAREALVPGSVLVIINALDSTSVGHWALPTAPALTAEEVEAVYAWVVAGGGLLLVADHMPFPGGVEHLARRFGLELTNGFAIDTATWDPIVHRRSDGTLLSHPVTDGRGPGSRVDSVATYWGHAFRALDSTVVPLLRYGPGVVSYLPDTAWRFVEKTPVHDVQGWLQGAALTVGAGRVVVLGEAGMLSAQLMGPNLRRRVGLNAPEARQNQLFILNVMRWLSRGDQ